MAAINMQSQNSNKCNNFTSNNSYGERFRSRNRVYTRGRSKVPYRKIDFNHPNNKGRCKWHILFGDNAYHCTLPCLDSGKALKPMPIKIDPANSLN